MSPSSDLAKHEKDRAALISEDRSLRGDHANAAITPTEIKADALVRELRDAEAVSVWAAEYDDIPHPFPGMEFLTGRNIIVQTKMFKILTKAITARQMLRSVQ